MFAPMHPSQIPNRRPPTSSAAAPSPVIDQAASARKRRRLAEEGGDTTDGAIDVDMLSQGEGQAGSAGEDDWDDGVQWKGKESDEVELPSEADMRARSRAVGAGGVIKEVKCNLTSIKDLRAEVLEKKHSGEGPQ